MQRISVQNKKNIYGGLSFWSFAMGGSLLVNMAVQGINSLISTIRGPQQQAKPTSYNNSWASGTNSYNSGTPLYLRFGLTPGKAAMMVGLPSGGAPYSIL
ncbi:MPN313 family protein [[Mycoplasma] testudinis]|uniref:MPN313 family protein n=1 Tax=[Mycoplasma] testudinis TaxID=33924 RepID=UPI0005657F5F|nr:hypothetical protein [[Mycoplasma] testudinis]